MPFLPHMPGSIGSDDPRRSKRIVQPGETISFGSAFMDAKRAEVGSPAGLTISADPKAAMAQARRQWADRKANAHRMPEAGSVAATWAADPGIAVADARAAKLVRLQNAYRDQR